MNQQVNSQVQSPFVRTVSRTKTKPNWTHQLADNVPPVSFTKVESAGTDTLLGGTFRYEIPQNGYLYRQWLKLTWVTDSQVSILTWNSAQADSSIVGIPATTDVMRPLQHFALGPLAWVKLQTHNKDIQTIYRRELAGMLERAPADQKSLYYNAMRAQDANGQPVDFSVTQTNTTVTCYVPLLWSSCDIQYNNFSTRFVEDMEVVVQMNSVAGTNGALVTGTEVVDTAVGTRGVTVAVVSYFYNWHDKIENRVRNTNFPKGQPATILARDAKEEVYPFALGTNPQTFDIRSNNACYALSVQVYTTDNAYVKRRQEGRKLTELRLLGAGQELWKTTSQESETIDAWDFELSTLNPRPRGPVASLEGVYAAELAAATNPGATPLKINYSNIAHIPFGFSSNPLYNTGVLGLQTISNPQLEITTLTTPTADFRVSIIVHHYKFIRIDSDNGTITTSLDT